MPNQDFPSVSKSAWLAQVQKDLKEKTLDSLDWAVSEQLRISPLVHGEDFTTSPKALSVTPNQWEICEQIPIQDAAVANRLALNALEGGAEGLEFVWTGTETPDWALLFKDIYLDFIGLHFSGLGVEQNPGAVFADLAQRVGKQDLTGVKILAERLGMPTLKESAEEKETSSPILHGTLAYHPLKAEQAGIQADWRYAADLLAYGKAHFPGFRLFQIDLSHQHAGKDQVLNELTLALQMANRSLEEADKRKISLADLAPSMHFNFAIGTSYFLEISKLRAFHLLWLNLLKAWNLPLQAPYIAVQFSRQAYDDALYANMIRATTMAMSAVLGGANRLCVMPYDSGREAQAQYSPEFGRRIARNVQHLLKMESFFDQANDPAAGSYYIESLTMQLAKQAWSAFCATPKG